VPASQRIAPQTPSSPSVAQRATVRNALALNRVSLIGVYGTPSQRRALLRLPNGRYQKVQVGDRVDGGRVAAIGESEIRYVKGGRNVVLRLPSG
jgi:type IV pilus biogenesis protein PilP